MTESPKFWKEVMHPPLTPMYRIAFCVAATVVIALMLLAAIFVLSIVIQRIRDHVSELPPVTCDYEPLIAYLATVEHPDFEAAMNFCHFD